MKKEQILATIKKLQPSYLEEGLLLLGIFGSYAREEQTHASDLDLLIETTPSFLKKYKGFRAFSRLDEIKTELEKIFDIKIDLVDKKGLQQHNNTHIIESALYVS